MLRDLSAVFVSRQALLPPGETLEQHRQWQREEAAAVQHDRDNPAPRTGGLFKGCFAPTPRRAQLHVVRDNEDGVDRCPMCTWELEDGGCAQCGLVFDAAGDIEWDNGFTGFSDFDDMSEHDPDDLDALDADMGLDYPYLDDHGLMMRRFLDAGIAMRRPMSHSEAGSRRSYSQSIADIYGEEMDTVAEEDEDEEDDDDSSMHDFIVDDDPDDDDDDSTSGASSTPAQTPQPPRAHARPRPSARARPVVEESETSSSVAEDEDDDDDDAGPVRRGPLHRAHTRALHRANGSSSSLAPSSSVVTDASTEELDEDTQALLQEQGWQLQHDEDDEDDDMGDDDDEDSDGARTTVGWEPLANSIDRVRMGGSLTPTADRPRPSAPIRPPSRGPLDASRGLRRRSSVLTSAAAAPYEDGEADDDDSDQEADVSRLAMQHLRTRRSQLHVRPVAPPPQEVDTDDNSDQSQAPVGRRTARTQRREYDPRISWMFASHQANLQEHQQMTGALIDVESRAMTPLGRPRTANRSRHSPAPAFSPFLPPARLRTPLGDTTAPHYMPASRVLASPSRRSAMSPALPDTGRPSSATSGSSVSGILTPGSSTSSSQNSIDSTIRTHAAAAMDMIDRPQSRVSARPPSAAGRRSSANFSPVPFAHGNIGLHGQGAALAPYQARGATNPWAAFVQRGLRNRNSQLRLREQSSAATLRAPASRVNIRETAAAAAAAAAPPQNMRTQASRNNLRPQPSRRQLSAQASTRTLRASEHTRPPSTGPTLQAPNSPPATRTMRLPPDERDSRARELVTTRELALGLTRTNPFTPGFRRLSNAADLTTVQAPASIPPHHVRSNSNESMHSVNSTGTAHGAPNSPRLARRTSNRNMASAPPPVQGPYATPYAPAYPTGTYRARQASAPGGAPIYESTLHTNMRGLNANPMVSGPLI